MDANLIPSRKYREDINGLRAIAVVAVIIFHFGFLPKGFLGVDVFFVISGFLITGIIYRELAEGKFSILNFYLRRTRRIIPLALFISSVALLAGIYTMLPDDLENLSQSVIATSFFSNNILQAITTKDYWDVVNEFKPLMHTWSLGVEEQFYFLYPFMLMLLGKKRIKWVLPVISIAALVSLTLYLSPYSDFQKFYLIFFRFWEIAAGGMLAVALKGKLISHKYSACFIALLLMLLTVELAFLPVPAVLILTVLTTLGILASANETNRLASLALENPLMIILGKISFSLYMWHQLLLAFGRYFWVQELLIPHLIAIAVATVLLSLLTYHLIEQPFCDKKRVRTPALLAMLGLLFVLLNGSAYYIYTHAGVLKDIPELGIAKKNVQRGIHAKYNNQVNAYNNNFKSTDKTNVLIIGNSFARDWTNVLLESKFSETLELSYIAHPDKNPDLSKRVEQADIIFYSTPEENQPQKLGIPESKLWAVGTKSFGVSNGIFYNYSGEDYFEQRTRMEHGITEKNEKLRAVWGDRYLNLIAKVCDDNQMVPVFSPTHQFISQDCRHFTQAGAIYFAKLFEEELAKIFAPFENQ